MDTFIGLILFVVAVVGGAWFIIEQKKKDKKEGSVVPAPILNKVEESGSYLGAGNPNEYGPRPLWKFKHPGSYYKNVEVYFDGVYSFTIADGAVRTNPDAKGANGVSLKPGTLWKPISDETPPNLVIHGPGGSTYTKCTLKY